MKVRSSVPVGVSLPRELLYDIDEARGRISRSTYVTILLERQMVADKLLAKTKAQGGTKTDNLNNVHPLTTRIPTSGIGVREV